MVNDPDTAARLKQLLTAIGGYDDPRRAAGEWKQVWRLLQQTSLPPGRVNGVVGMRDAAGLAALIAELAGADADEAAPAGAEAPPVDAETCRRALRAFRKRLRLTKLDDESKLGRGPLSKGSSDAYAAIEPPNDWPDEVWQELARQGRLKYIGHGFYEMPSAPKD